MQDPPGETRADSWWDACGCGLLLQVFRQAVRLRPLLFALVGVLTATLGWRTFGWVFSESVDPLLTVVSVSTDAEGNQQLVAARDSANRTVPGALRELYGRWPWETPTAMSVRPIVPTHYLPESLEWIAHRLPVKQLLAFSLIFDINSSVTVVAFLVLCLLWGLAVWALIGGAITRIAAVAFTTHEQIGWNRAMDFSIKNWLSYFSGPALPLAGVLILALFMGIGGLFFRIPQVGLLFAGVGWPLWLIAGLLAALLLLGLAVAWPLMWGTISTEGTDAFDSLGRGYGYVFGQPLWYLVYGLVALFLGWLGWYVVDLFAGAIVRLSEWGASWGATRDVIFSFDAPRDQLSTPDWWGANLLRFWNGIVALLPVAFLSSYFWTAAVAIYLLLRRREDQTELTDVYLEDEGDPHGLPPLTTDASGVPEVVDLPPDTGPAKGTTP
jgi:hypothetical protein